MTVTNTNSSVSYPGDDASTDFPTTFRFLEDSHLTVTLIDEDDVESVLTLGTHYNVVGAGDDEPGGTVVMVDPPAAGETLLIERNTPITQETSFGTFTRFSPETHEEALDKLTMIAQEADRRLDGLEAGSTPVDLTGEVVTDTFVAAEPIEDTFPRDVACAGLPAGVILIDVRNLTTPAEVLTAEGLLLGPLVADQFTVNHIEGLTPGQQYRVKYLVLNA